MAIKKTIEIDVVAPNAQQNINSVTTSLNNASKSSDNLNKTLNTDKGGGKFNGLKDSIGGLIPGFDKASAGASSFNKQLLVLLANPIGLVIGAIVIALTALFKAFQSTDEGADKLEQIMSGLSATIVVVRDRIIAVGGAIVKFLSGDLRGAFEDGKKAISGFGDEVQKEFKKASEATKLLQEVEDSMVSLGVQRAKLNKNLAESKELLSDENATYAQKKKAIDDIRKGEGNYTDEAIKNARKRLKAAELETKLSSDERTKAIAEAQTALIDLETESANIKRSANKQQKQLEKERVTNQQEAINAQKTALKEAQDAEKAIIDEKLKDSQLSFQQQRDLVNNDNKLAIKDKKEFLKKINEEESKSIEEHKKALIDLENKYTADIENLKATTDQQKLDLQKSRDLKELENVVKTEEEKAKLKTSLDEKYKILQSQLDDKNAKDKIAKEDAQFLKLQELTLAKADFEKLQLVQKYEAEYIAAEGNAELQLALKEKLSADIKAIDDKDAENKKILRQQEITAAGQTFGILSDLLGKQSKAGKAFAVAQALINTYQGITAGVKLGYPQAIPAVLAASVTGFKAVKDILKTNPKSSGASSASSSSGGGAPTATPQFNLVGQSSTNQLSQTIANQQKQPIKTYVVAGDVTTQQGLDRNAVQTSTFGG